MSIFLQYVSSSFFAILKITKEEHQQQVAGNVTAFQLLFLYCSFASWAKQQLQDNKGTAAARAPPTAADLTRRNCLPYRHILDVTTAKAVYSRIPSLGSTIRGFIFLCSSKPLVKRFSCGLCSCRWHIYRGDKNITVMLSQFHN